MPDSKRGRPKGQPTHNNPLPGQTPEQQRALEKEMKVLILRNQRLAGKRHFSEKDAKLLAEADQQAAEGDGDGEEHYCGCSCGCLAKVAKLGELCPTCAADPAH